MNPIFNMLKKGPGFSWGGMVVCGLLVFLVASVYKFESNKRNHFLVKDSQNLMRLYDGLNGDYQARLFENLLSNNISQLNNCGDACREAWTSEERCSVYYFIGEKLKSMADSAQDSIYQEFLRKNQDCLSVTHRAG